MKLFPPIVTGLQWGRDVTVADRSLRLSLFYCKVFCFNGAATLPSRIGAYSLNIRARELKLQWGRDATVADPGGV